MTETGKPAPTRSAVIEAANRLLPVLAELDQIQAQMVELQRKSQKATNQILTLAKAQARSWSEARQAQLDLVDRNIGSLQLKLGVLQRRQDKLRRRFESALGTFKTVFLHQDDRLADLQIAHALVHRQNTALDRSLLHLVRTYTNKMARHLDTTGYQVPSESHEYIALGIPAYMEMLCRIDALLSVDPDFTDENRRYRPVSFLEVGSGAGRNMMLVKSCEILLLDRVHGFDINPDQIAEGEALYDLGDELEVADAMTFDYGGFDVVFSYRPFSDLTLQRQLEARMAETMSPSAYLMAPYSVDLPLYPELTPMDGRKDIWKKTG